MPRQTFETEVAIHKAIDEYLRTSPMTTLSEIAEYVEQQTGTRPSNTTILNHISDKGYKKVWVKEN